MTTCDEVSSLAFVSHGNLPFCWDLARRHATFLLVLVSVRWIMSSTILLSIVAWNAVKQKNAGEKELS